MAKKRRGRKGSRGYDDSSSENDKDDIDKSKNSRETSKESSSVSNSVSNSKALDFKERREQQRQAAAEKRKSKQRCHTCGKAGHVRRDCPGFEDDGARMCKFTKSKGDPGALVMKGGKGGKKNEKKIAKEDKGGDEGKLLLPKGFSPMAAMKTGGGSVSQDMKEEDGDGESGGSDFCYYDAGCNRAATLQYIQTGRSGLIHKKTPTEAKEEYHRIVSSSIEKSNYGGCIDRKTIKSNAVQRAGTAPEDNLEPLDLDPDSTVWYVAEVESMLADKDAVVSALREEFADSRVVGAFCKLDYSKQCEEHDRALERATVLATIMAAARAHIPVQIQTLPCAQSTEKKGKQKERGQMQEDPTTSNPYLSVMHDLAQILLEATNQEPNVQIHLSCWNGKADHMNALLQSFPTHLWIGLDGTASFSKATLAHECAFDVPLDRILLETGANIPSNVASVVGRKAFVHCGLLPFVADAIAKCKNMDADHIARVAAMNTMKLYQLKN